MENKLQELLDKVYREGVAKGEEVAAAIVKDAEHKAEKILEDAKREAVQIRRQAQEETEELKRNVASELRLSAGQAISALRQKISGMIAAKVISEPVGHAFSDRAFIQKMIETLLQNWQSGQATQNLTLLLPPEQEELHQYFTAKASDLMNDTLQIDIDGKLEHGFRIGPALGSYVISFTDRDFETFLMDYLRPKTKEILYGVE